MIVGRALGWLLVLTALVLLGLDVWAWTDTGVFRLMSAGELWFSLDPGSLGTAQAAIQRYVHPWIWDPLVQSILLAPAAIVLGILGLMFLILFRQRRKTRVFS